MLELIKKYIKGDKYLWAFITILAIFSFLPVYSASSNLVYTVGKGSVFSHLFKHATFLIIGMGIIIFLQRVNYKYFGGLAYLGLPVIGVLLVVTLIQGTTIDGANAARWLKIPGTAVTIQTSTLASLFLMIYIARYLTKNRNKKLKFSDTILPLLAPMFLIIASIFPANASTAVMLFVMSMTLLFLGGYPFKFILGISGAATFMTSIFVFLALNFGNLVPNSRVHTWKSRVEQYFSDSNVEVYQVKHAKAAIAMGGTFGRGSGKSVLKQTLPQSSSDFIFAIIVEEYGFIGAFILIFIFLLILFRIGIIATKIHTFFGTLLVFAVGIPIVFQALINMGVAVNLFPVTGQPLPMISYGGTSLWITCISFGIILSVSTQIKTAEEIELERKKNSEAIIEDIA